MNSTHAAWLNGVCALAATLVAVLPGLPGLPTWAIPVVLAGNAALHALLPDAKS